jgi:hypothetical protein
MDKQAVNVWIDCDCWGYVSAAAFVIKVMNIWVECFVLGMRWVVYDIYNSERSYWSI